MPIYQRPRTSTPASGHKIYPFECVYLHAWTGGREVRDGIGSWLTFYNQQRPHAAHNGQIPDVVYHQHGTSPPANIAA